MEMMRVRILIYLCVLMSCHAQTHTASVKDSGEQSALQEALLLVDILKSEYARVLRQKTTIHKMKENATEAKDVQTRATTTAPTDAVTNTHTGNSIRHRGYTPHSSQRYHQRPPQAANPYNYGSHRNPRHDQRLPQAANPDYYDRSYISPRYYQRPPQAANRNFYDFPRRRFYSYRDYYGSYGRAKPWRRMDYEDVYRPQPGQTIPTSTSTFSQSATASPTNSSTHTTLSSITTTASTTVSEMPTSSIPSHTPSSSTTPTIKPKKLSTPILPLITLSTCDLNKKQPPLISKRFLSLPNNVNAVKNKKTQTTKLSEKIGRKKLSSVEKTTITYEPEQAQVAAELENELQASIDSPTSLPSSSSHRQSVSWRPTTRIHMAKSTPYHLPLPQNHAFCYTNPNNSLCRTFIK